MRTRRPVAGVAGGGAAGAAVGPAVEAAGVAVVGALVGCTEGCTERCVEMLDMDEPGRLEEKEESRVYIEGICILRALIVTGLFLGRLRRKDETTQGRGFVGK